MLNPRVDRPTATSTALFDFKTLADHVVGPSFLHSCNTNPRSHLPRFEYIPALFFSCVFDHPITVFSAILILGD